MTDSVVDHVSPSHAPVIARMVLAYAVFGSLWILLSDHVVDRLSFDRVTQTQVSLYKGVAFILVTALLLTYLLRRELGARERSHAAMRESQLRYRQVFRANAQPMWIHDCATLRFLSVNDAAVSTYGWSRDDLLAMTVLDICPEEAIVQLREHLAESAANGLTSPGIQRHRRHDGSVMDVEIRRHSLRFQGRDAELVLVVDVTERLSAEGVVRASEQFLRATLDALPVCIAIVDGSGTVVNANRAWQQLADQSNTGPQVIREGENYLEACEAATGEAANAFIALADGIREILSGRCSGARIEVCNASSGQERWFVADAARIAGKGAPRVVVGLTDVTERHEAQLAFRAQASRLQDYVSTSPSVMYAMAVAGDKYAPEWVSENVMGLLGYSVQEALTAGWWLSHLHPEDVASAETALERLGEAGTTSHDYRFQRSDGTWLWIHDRLQLQVAPRNGRASVIGTWTDITELQSAREALAASEGRLRATFEHAAVGVARVGLDGRWLTVNPHLCRILGYTREELQALRFDEVTHIDDVGRDRDSLRRMLAGEFDAHSQEKRYVRKSGETVWVNRSASLVRTSDGAPSDFVLIIEDISERKHAEESVRKLTRAVEQSAESIVITDREGCIEYVNGACVQSTGYTRDELIGRNPRILQSGRTSRPTYESMWATLALGRTWRGEFWNRRKDGQEYLESALVSPICLTDGRVTHYVAMKEDVTEARRIAAELDRHRHHLEEIVAARTREAEDARRQAEIANEAKSVFLANMSHEIRTPMNGVLGMLELLTRDSMTETQLDMVRTAQESGRILLGVIDDILDFSKIEAGRMEIERVPTSVVEVVEGLCISMAPLASRRDVDLTAFVDPDIPEFVSSDPLRLRQILFNLIGNAIKFSAGRNGHRGRVAVRVTTASLDPFRIAFAVVDNGIGMEPDLLPRLFVPFTQGEPSTTRRYGGTGLGLPICKRLAELMNAEIDVTSRLGAGSTFTLTLPLDQRTNDPVARSSELAGVSCIVVDSPRLDSEGMCSYLRHAGATVQTVDDLHHACRAVNGLNGIVVVLSDARSDHAREDTGDGILSDLSGVRMLWITHGRRKRVRLKSPFAGTLDGTVLRRSALVCAVAILAGRASPEIDHDEEAFAHAHPVGPAPTPAEARERGELILVAEDDHMNTRVLRKQLDLLGRTAEFTVDGEEALWRWRAGGYALLLTDLHMPRMDGYALTAAIRDEETMREPGPGRMPIVVLTANALRGEVERAQSAGADDYLTKPLSLDRLRATIDRWLPPVPNASVTGVEHDTQVNDAVNDAVDLQVLKSHLGDDPTTVRELLHEFLAGARRQVEDMHMAFAGNDARRIAAVAHRLKSSARAVGALVLGDLCADIEKAGRADDGLKIAGQMTEVDGALVRVENAIRSLLPIRSS